MLENIHPPSETCAPRRQLRPSEKISISEYWHALGTASLFVFQHPSMAGWAVIAIHDAVHKLFAKNTHTQIAARNDTHKAKISRAQPGSIPDHAPARFLAGESKQQLTWKCKTKIVPASERRVVDVFLPTTAAPQNLSTGSALPLENDAASSTTRTPPSPAAVATRSQQRINAFDSQSGTLGPRLQIHPYDNADSTPDPVYSYNCGTCGFRAGRLRMVNHS